MKIILTCLLLVTFGCGCPRPKPQPLPKQPLPPFIQLHNMK